jgi:hypothetical protein
MKKLISVKHSNNLFRNRDATISQVLVIKRFNRMKKPFWLIASISIFSLFIFSCQKDNSSVEDTSILNNIETEDRIIANAEKEVGKLEKKDFTFNDEQTGSSFVLRIAAQSKNEIEDYINENEIKFFGVSEQLSNEYYKAHPNKSSVQNTSNPDEGKSNYSGGIITELISKKLGKGITGFGMTISPKISNEQSKKSLKSAKVQGYCWKEPPFAWAEEMQITPINESYPGGFLFALQSRGCCWFWSGSGSEWHMLTNGQLQKIWVDGPKYTRIGTNDSDAHRYSVTWINL